MLRRSSLPRANFFRCGQLHTNAFHQFEFHAVSMCLSRALSVTGKESVSRCPAWQNLAGLGTIGRVVVAVCFQDETHNPSPDAQIRIFGLGQGDNGSSQKKKHSPFLQFLERILTIDVPIA